METCAGNAKGKLKREMSFSIAFLRMLSLIQKKPLVFLLVGVVLISFSPILVKLSAEPAIRVGFYRNLFGLLFLLPLVILKKDSWFKSKWTLLLPLFAGTLFFFDLWGWHIAIDFIGPGIATLLGNFQVFFLTLFAVVFLREKLSLLFLVSVPLALLGVYFIVSHQGHMEKNYLWGVALGLGTAFCYSVFLLIIRKAQTLKEKISADMNLTYITICTGTLFAVAMFASETSFQIETPRAGGLLLAYGFFPHFLGWIIISRCLPLVKTSVAGITLLLQPVLSFAWEVIIFEKQFSVLQLTGGAIAVVAIYLGTKGQQKMEHRNDEDRH